MDNQKTWLQILDFIKEQISAANFRTWFSQTALQEVGQVNITIIVPSAFIKGQLSARYEGLIKEATIKILGQEYDLLYLIDASHFSKTPSLESDEEEIFQLPPNTTRSIQTNLNPKYTLKNFVVGLTNNLAYAAAQAVVQNPGISYNPLFIYGPSGVGKTHLMQGIGNELLVKNQALRLIYAPSKRFMNDFVASIQNKRMGDFRA